MVDNKVEMTVTGGSIQGIAGAGSVRIENFVIHNRALEQPAPAHTDAGPTPPCPYPGLAYFGPDNADQFFGRDTAITRLSAAVRQQSLTALVGASGTGKSSVVLAGLAPYLHSKDDWRFSYFRIGTELDRDPFRALARALVPLYVASDDDTERLTNTKKLASKLEAGELTLRDVFADCRSRNKGKRILLIADQFEEGFTLIEDDAARQRFIDVLLAGFLDPLPGSSPDMSLILTLRADFYGRALRHRPLADALQGHVENLGPMTRNELQVAIVRPAEKAGVSFEPGLVQTLLDDIGGKPGSLPLLQFALREIWGRQENRTITRVSYDAIGGIEGALAQRAEAIFTTLTEGGANARMEKAFQRLFTRLVTLGEGQEDTRRVVERQELGDEVWPLAQRLAGEDNRLVVTNAPAPARETAEVVHEALIRHWPKLVEWIDRDRAFQTWLRQIRPNIELWLANPADEGSLLRGSMLAQAIDWHAKRHDDLSLKEQGLIEASVALRRRIEEEKEAARQTEFKHQQEQTEAAINLAQEQRRRARIARIFGIVTGAAAIVAIILVLGLVGASTEAEQHLHEAHTQAREASRQTVRAQASLAKIENDHARYFEAASAALAGLTDPLTLDTNPDQIAPWAELLRTTVDKFLLPPLQHGDVVNAAAFDTKGERVVTASSDKTARIWDARTGLPIGPPMQHGGQVYAAAFDAKGERVVTASRDKTTHTWDARTVLPIGPPMRHSYLVTAAAFDAKGERVVTMSWDQTVRICDARTGLPIGPPMQHDNAVTAAAFDAKGERVVTASWETARIWDAHTGLPIGPPMQHGDEVYAAAFDAAGERVVTASWETARIWDAHTGVPIGPPMQHSGTVFAAAFDAKGERVVTASSDETARIWDARTGLPIGPPMQHSGTVFAAAFDAKGERVVTASSDKTARIWDAPLTGQALLNQIRSKLGRSAPEPLRGPTPVESRTRYVDAIARGLNTIWTGTVSHLFQAH